MKLPADRQGQADLISFSHWALTIKRQINEDTDVILQYTETGSRWQPNWPLSVNWTIWPTGWIGGLSVFCPSQREELARDLGFG